MPDIQIKRGLAAALSGTNPIIANGEPVFEIDTLKLKIGDGITPYNGLSVVGDDYYALSSHDHPSSKIIDFNSSVSGLLSVKNINGSGYISVASNDGNYIITATGLQPSGNYSVVGHSHTSSDIVNFNASVSGLVSGIYAPLNSPALTGIPTVPTANSGTNNNQAASTAFVRTEISNLVSSAPSTLDTLNELATALGNDANFSTTVTNTLAGKANLNGATFTGAISSPSGNFTQSLLVNGTAVSVSGHSHNASNISDFNSGVLSAVYSGVIPLNSGLFVKTRTGGTLQSTTLSSNDITDFNSSVSGILPVKNIVAGSNITVSSSSGIYTINSTATGSSSTSVIEYNNVSNFPSSGVGSTIYISTDTGRIYRWASSVYQELGPVSYAPIGSDSRWDLFLPPAPTGLAVTPGNAQATLAWSAPTVSIQTPITDYTVQYSANSGSSWTTFTRSASTSTTATVTGLTNGQGYVLRVAAINGIGTGAYSAASAATPIAKTPFLTDLFDGSAGVLLSDASHSPRWANLSVEASQSSLARSGSSAAVRGQVDGYGNCGSVLNTGKTNFYAQGVVATVGSFSIMARTTNQVSSPGNYSVGYAFVLDSAGGASILRNQRFSSTVLASTTIPTMQVGDTFGISANGSTIAAFFNGSQIMSVVDSTFTAGTFCGLSLGASASRFDVFDV